MTAQLFTLPREVILSNTGALIPGAQAYFYTAGTSTPQAVYTEHTLTTAHTQPVLADAHGRFPAVYYDDALQYKVMLTDASDVEIYTQDYGLPAQVLSQEAIGSTLWPRTTGEIAAGVTPVNYQYEPGNVNRYGTNLAQGVTDMTTAIQNAIDSEGRAYFPVGTYLITNTIYLDSNDVMYGDGRASIIKGNLTKAMVAGASAPARTYYQSIHDLLFDNTDRDNANGVGLNLQSVTGAKIFKCWIMNVETAIKIGGTGSLGAYYNEFHAVDITTVDDAYINGTLANENKVFGGRVGTCVNGTTDDNNTGNSYFGFAVEAFTGTAHKNGTTTTAQYTRYINSRIENINTSSPYDNAIGFELGGGSGILGAAVYIYGPQIVNIATDYQIDSNTNDTNILSDTKWRLYGGTDLRTSVVRTVTRDVASLGATTFRHEGPFTVTGAAVGTPISVVLPASWPLNIMVGQPIVTAADTVYLPIHNPSGGAVDPASGDFIFHVWIPTT